MTPARRQQAATLAISLAVLSTIVFLPEALHRWVLPKEVVLAIACLLSVFAVASGRLPRWTWMLGGAALLVLALAALTGAAPVSQLFGRWPRYEGLVTIPVYIATGWMGARLLGPAAGAARYRALYSASAVAALLIGAVSVLESLGLRPIASDLTRPGSLLGNATDQGIVGVMLAALLVLPSLDVSASPRRRVFYAAGLTFAITSTVLSASRAAIIALAVVALIAAVVFVIRSPKALRLRRGVVALAGVAAMAAFALLIPLTRNRLLGTSPSAGQSSESRLTIWDAASRVLGQDPLLGAGPSGFLDAVGPFKPESWSRDIGAGVTIDSPHNWMLQAAVAGGIPLLLAALAFAGFVLYVGLRAWRQEGSGPRASLLGGALLAVLGWGLALLTHFTSPGTTILAAFLLGAIVAAAPVAQLRAPVAWIRAAALSIWTVLLILAMAAELPLNAGVRAAAAGAPIAASEAFDAAQALRPWDADIASIAAQSLASAADQQVDGAAEEAIIWARRSLAQVPSSALSSKALAVGLQYTGDLAGARQVLTDLVTRSPSDSEALHRLGGICFLLGDADAAVQNLERAAELDPRNRDIWVTLRYVYEQVGDSAGVSRADQQIATIGG